VVFFDREKRALPTQLVQLREHFQAEPEIHSNALHREPDPPRRRGRRKGAIVLVSLLVCIVSLCALAPHIAKPLIRTKLQSMVSKHLDARLTIGDLSYEFPWGVRAKNIALVAKDQSGQPVDLLRLRNLRLSLAKSPWSDGPLVIDNIAIDQPQVNVILESGGIVGRRSGKTDSESSIGGTKRLSDFLKLKRFEITGGQVTLDDRRPRPGNPLTGPITWADIHVGIDLTQNAAGEVYHYEISGRNDSLMAGDIHGTLDPDERLLDVERYALAVQARKGADYAGLPPALANALRSNEVEGAITFSGSAHVPLKDPLATTHDSVIDMPGGHARLSNIDGNLDALALRVRVSNRLSSDDRRLVAQAIHHGRTKNEPILASSTGSPNEPGPVTTTPRTPLKSAPATQPLTVPPLNVTVENFRMESGGTWLQVLNGKGLADPETGYWRIREIDAQLNIAHDRRSLPQSLRKILDKLNVSGMMRLTAVVRGPLVRPDEAHPLVDLVDYEAVAYPRDVSFQPPNFPVPVTHITGTVRATPTAIELENVEGDYGDDHYDIASARLPIEDPAVLDHEIRVKEIVGTLQLRGKTEDYPRPLDWVARNLHPMGQWTLTGDFAWLYDPFGEAADYRFDIHTDHGAGAISQKRIPLTDVRCQLYVSPRVVEIRQLTGKSLDGYVVVQGVVEPGRPCGYGLDGWIRNIDVRALATMLCDEPPSRLSGRGSVDFHAWGQGKHDGRPASDFAKATGRFEIINGEFWDAPVVEDVVNRARSHFNPNATGDAAGVFEIHDRWVRLPRIAISSPMLGIQGYGWIGFDKQLRLNVVAAPLADWKEQMHRLNIPLVSDVAGEVLGGVQTLLNAASKTLLYEFRVVGTTKHPTVFTVPTPVLTDSVAALFNAMVKGQRLGDAVDRSR
jgi:hypothetical protein